MNIRQYLIHHKASTDLSRFADFSRQLKTKYKTLDGYAFDFDEEDIEQHLQSHDDFILYYVAAALKKGISVQKIYDLSSIDPWFIEKIKNIVDTEEKLKQNELDKLRQQHRDTVATYKKALEIASINRDDANKRMKNYLDALDAGVNIEEALNELSSKKAFKEGTNDIMTKVISIINTIEDFSVETLQTEIKGWITTNNIGFGQVMMPLRLALVGALQGPDVFDIMFMIGKEESIKRIEKAIATL